MIHSIIKYNEKGFKLIEEEKLSEDIANGSGMIWVDIVNPVVHDLQVLEKKLMIEDSLALELCANFNQHSRLLDFKEYLFLVLHSVKFKNEKTKLLKLTQLNIFLGKNFLVTLHMEPISLLENISNEFGKNHAILCKGADFLLYNIIDSFIDSYFPLLDRLDEEIDRLETSIFRDPDKAALNKAFDLKRVTLQLKKDIAPLRENLLLLTRETTLVKASTVKYFRATYDHIIRVIDLIETYRDLLTTLLDTYVSMVSNKLNEIMKVLTIIATIMMPLTLVTGIYGMNFRFMPEIDSPYGYAFAWAVMIIIAVVMVAYFKKKQWV
ncbi:MAG: magnesium/cobalt transporter CorA [archaeon]|nr:magnesium/cobalt transporter CorA [Candidatus Micrarchaeota archaeon]